MSLMFLEDQFDIAILITADYIIQDIDDRLLLSQSLLSGMSSIKFSIRWVNLFLFKETIILCIEEQGLLSLHQL